MAPATDMAMDREAAGAPTRPDLLSVKEVASILGVHEQTVRRLIDRKKLTAIEVGRLVKVRRGSVLEYYRNHVR
jgi:excisionase family DNA binding protein